MSGSSGGRTWRDVPEEFAAEVRDYLVREGGVDAGDNVGPGEAWRVRFSDATFTSYEKGTLYSSASLSLDPAVEVAWTFIEAEVGPRFVPSDREFLIGLDETGKGELVGHTVLVGVLVPQSLAPDVERLVAVADTKRRRSVGYWDDLFRALDVLKARGLDFVIEKVPPWHVDRFNINRMLDVTYQRILNTFFRRAQVSLSRVVIDNYGVGPSLDRFLRAMQNSGTEVVVEAGADDRYLEARVASVLAKRVREKVIEAVNASDEFRIDGLSVGSGNASDPKTLEWLRRWKEEGRPWPWFIKRSFKTIWQLDGRQGPPAKKDPPIRDDLLSEEFREGFEEGRLSITGLSVVCPSCGEVCRAALVTLDSEDQTSGRCVACRKVLPDLGFTLRYYCGFILPDSNIILGGLLSKDLESRTRFFEGFTVLLSGVVRTECDGPGGKKELAKLSRFGAMGRIGLQEVSGPGGEGTSLDRDDLILDAALSSNAILVTGDGNLRAAAQGQQVFTLSTR